MYDFFCNDACIYVVVRTAENCTSHCLQSINLVIVHIKDVVVSQSLLFHAPCHGILLALPSQQSVK